MFSRLEIYPFGDNTLIYSDGDQYLSFTSYLQNSFFTDNNLLYSWSNALGGNMLGTFAYYCSSPFNLLLVLFPADLVLGYHILFCIKVLLSALSFAVLLNILWKPADEKAIMLFSISYPFMGYIAAYAWNQSWMDGVMFLPLLLAGIINTIRKQKILLYVIMLFLILIANFYIGYMICIASIIMFFGVLCVESKRCHKEVIKIIVLYIWGSLLAAFQAAMLLLPTYFSLPQGRRQSISRLFSGMDYRCMPGDILSMMYGNGSDFLENSPFIYVGILQFVLIVIFFINKKVSRKCKVVSGITILIFLISFSNTTLDIIWHGLSDNVCFNYRYSFILSFIFELIAFCSFIHIEKAKGQILSAAIYMSGLTVFMISEQEKKNVDSFTLMIDIVMILMILYLLHEYAKRRDWNDKTKAISLVLLVLVAFSNLFGNCIVCMKNRVQARPVSKYEQALLIENAVNEIVSESEDELYRRASSCRYGRCDAMLFGFAGVQNYASTENIDVLRILKRLGIEHAWMWAQYNDNVPLSTDILLGIRYIVSDSSYKHNFYTLSNQITSQGEEISILKNRYALPLIFPVKSEAISADKEDTFSLLNYFWDSISEAGGSIFQSISYDRNIIQKDSGKDISIHFTAADSNPIYAYIPDNENVTVEDTSELLPLEHSENQNIVYIGTFAKGANVDFIVHVPAEYDLCDNIIICSENPDILFAKAKCVLEKNIYVEKESSSSLKMPYYAVEAEVLSSTIPYDTSWHIFIDGKEVLARKNMDMFLAFDCPKGMHQIQLIYRPKGFKLGCIISGSTILAVIYCELPEKSDAQCRHDRMKNRRKP